MYDFVPSYLVAKACLFADIECGDEHPEEVVCEGHQCNETTRGLYLSSNEVKNENKLLHELAFGLGLRPVMKASPKSPEFLELEKNAHAEKEQYAQDRNIE